MVGSSDPDTSWKQQYSSGPLIIDNTLATSCGESLFLTREGCHELLIATRCAIRHWVARCLFYASVAEFRKSARWYAFQADRRSEPSYGQNAAVSRMAHAHRRNLPAPLTVIERGCSTLSPSPRHILPRSEHSTYQPSRSERCCSNGHPTIPKAHRSP